jgi:gentisate 1,2-dioxygenase
VARTAEITDKSAIRTPSNASVYSQRARYFDSETAFNMSFSAIPGDSFVSERDRAFDPETGTKLLFLDQSAAMNLSFPATTPLVLAAYARIQAGDVLRHEPCASTVFGFVIQGQGHTIQGKDRIEWGTGDIFCLPGGVPISYVSGSQDSILWLVSNEPQLAFEHFTPPEASSALVTATHFPAAEIERELISADARLADRKAAGLAVILSSEKLQQSRNISPSLTLAMNQLGPGEAQPPHRHNSVAVSLVVNAPDCFSMIDGVRKDWSPWATVVTTPGSVHSHHNEGSGQANWLIVQDGGLYYHCRTMGFSYS